MPEKTPPSNKKILQHYLAIWGGFHVWRVGN